MSIRFFAFTNALICNDNKLFYSLKLSSCFCKFSQKECYGIGSTGWVSIMFCHLELEAFELLPRPGHDGLVLIRVVCAGGVDHDPAVPQQPHSGTEQLSLYFGERTELFDLNFIVELGPLTQATAWGVEENSIKTFLGEWGAHLRRRIRSDVECLHDTFSPIHDKGFDVRDTELNTIPIDGCDLILTFVEGRHDACVLHPGRDVCCLPPRGGAHVQHTLSGQWV